MPFPCSASFLMVERLTLMVFSFTKDSLKLRLAAALFISSYLMIVFTITDLNISQS